MRSWGKHHLLFGLLEAILEKCLLIIFLSQQSLLPIFTLNIQGSKINIVTSTELVQAIQKQPKTLALSPIGAKFASKILSANVAAHKVLMSNVIQTY